MATSPTLLILFNLLCIQKLIFVNSQSDPSNLKCIETERTALIKFKNTLIGKSGRLSSWTGQECCSWAGITCSTKTGRVLILDLHNPTPFDTDRFYNSEDPAYVAGYTRTCLSGDLSPELLNLNSLQHLDLSYNNFSNSKIPNFLGSFTNLQYLNVSVARFTGGVPRNLGNLSMLRVLDMSDFWNNRLSSKDLGWLSDLKSLRVLDLSGVFLGEAKDWLDSVSVLPSLTKLNLSNTLVSRIPPLSHPGFPSLTSFDLQWNTINSNVPPWIFNITGLVELRLDGNGFSGPISRDIDRLSALAVLGLSRNFFNASLPDSLFKLKNLSYLDVSQNRFRQTVPNGVVNLCNLKFLDLTQCEFYGKIPDFGDGCLRNLEVLRLSYNGLNGSIPSSIGTLSSLRELDLSNNVLSGSVPLSFGQLSSLEKLDVSNNSLSGIVSESHFAKQSKLVELSMFRNSLVLNFSRQWIPPFNLHSIKLSNCVIGPLFPLWLQTQTDVFELKMSNASISDGLPEWFEKVYSRVHYLDLSKNNISGKLPRFEEANGLLGRRVILNTNSFIGPLSPLPSDVMLFDVSNNFVSGGIPVQNGTNLTLEVLILSNNQLNGEFPDFLCEIKKMMILDLANNKFSGEIPDCIGEISNLAMLDLTNNTFYGEIPKSLSNLQLMSLHLHNNNFQGELPSLQNSTYLHIFDVAKNSLTGEIPHWIGENMENLAFLSLQSNEFHGEIPKSLCQVPELQLLNLAGNNLTGTLPPCFGNFSAMIAGESSSSYLVLDVDYGGNVLAIINGIERLYTTTMTFLTSLDVSDNVIVGEIPENLTQLFGLRNLDLGGNRLTGRIPESIGLMQELISLDLSRNRLSGRIPESLSDLNFLSHLNLSYNSLSGRIPTGNQLQTLDSSVYTGNDGLCGAPVVRRCDGDPVPGQGNGGDARGKTDNDDEDGDDDSLFPWFYAGIGPGFATAFLVVCGVLHFVKPWRYAVERFVVNVADGRCFH